MSRTAVVTGAGSGVGRAVALQLVREGWNVGLVGRRESALNETIQLAGQSSPKMFAAPCDVGDPAQVEGLAKLVMTNVRFFAPDAKDAALEPQCTAREVEKNVAMLMGLSMPLHLRSPFKDFPR